MRFSRAEALLFWGIQNLVDEKYNSGVFFVVCFYAGRNHLQGKVVWIIRAGIIFECRITNWPGFGRRPRFASNACSSLHSSLFILRAV